MKFQLLMPSVFLILTTFSSCFDLEKTVVYNGRIVEAFDTTKPIDSVLVQGCIQEFSLLPDWPDCDTKTFTDHDGNFNISFETDGFERYFLSYRKEGYSSLDSCKTLPDGSLECYLLPLPTVFHIFSPFKDDLPFNYDSLVVLVRTVTIDTTIHYVTGSFQNSFGRTSYYWTYDPHSNSAWEKSSTIIKVLDNSSVTIEAIYFSNKNKAKLDKVTLSCPKGIGNSYKILDDQ
jgi:hypothetical protein